MSWSIANHRSLLKGDRDSSDTTRSPFYFATSIIHCTDYLNSELGAFVLTISANGLLDVGRGIMSALTLFVVSAFGPKGYRLPLDTSLIQIVAYMARDSRRKLSTDHP